MSTEPDSETTRLTFRIGDVFPADDPFARYVMRLAIAAGDPSIATAILGPR